MNSFEERAVEVQALDALTQRFTDAALTEFDGPPFFDARTGRALASLEEVRLPIGFTWAGNWKVVLDQKGADAEGWVRDGRIRRRWWTRKRERVQSAAASGVSSAPPPAARPSPSSAATTAAAATTTTTTTPTTPATSTPAAPPTAPTPRILVDASTPPEDLLRAATQALQRVSEATTRLSTASTPDAARSLSEQGKAAIKDAEKALALLERAPTAPLAPRIKLSNDVSRASQRFNELAEQVSARVAGNQRRGMGNAAPPPTATTTTTTTTSSFGLVDDGSNAAMMMAADEANQQLRLAAIVSEVGLNEEIIRQRNEELKDISHKAATINSMMKDLAVMVDSQGETMKQVVNNANMARDRVEAGLVQVEKAEKYQTEGGSCSIQ